MQIILSINCPDFKCVKEKLEQAARLCDWVQLDIADGKFTKHQTWNNPVELQRFKIENPRLKFNIEMHLMIETPESHILNWVEAGAKRIIVHIEAVHEESLKEGKSDSSILRYLLENPHYRWIEFGLALNPDTPIKSITPHLRNFKFVQILAVPPGKAGQEFDKHVLDKVRFLNKNHPDVKIEVDGGINPETAKLCKEAGADILAAASYVFDSADPQRAYKELENV